jgi:hypothetical protein
LQIYCVLWFRLVLVYVLVIPKSRATLGTTASFGVLRKKFD